VIVKSITAQRGVYQQEALLVIPPLRLAVIIICPQKALLAILPLKLAVIVIGSARVPLDIPIKAQMMERA